MSAPLPSRLQRWNAQLKLFDRDLALAISPWVERLALSLGPLLRPPDDSSDGSPDGFDGIFRRGPYERLLATEWMFADELPEEFLRRAISGEHSFYKLALRAPRARLETTVLFDSGPEQLGAPRLAHLALLVVLAARAEAANAELSWGMLEPRELALRVGFTQELGRGFLAGRTALTATPESIGERFDGCADSWLVCGPRLAAQLSNRKLQLVEVSETQAPGERALELTLRRPARAPQRLRLELPRPDDCVRLLRDPFAVERPPEQKLPKRPTTGLRHPIFSPAGDRLYALTLPGDLAVTAIPRDIRSAVRSYVFRPPNGQTLIGAGWKQGPFAVTSVRNAEGLLTHVVRHPLTKRGQPKALSETYELASPSTLRCEGLAPAASLANGNGTALPFPDGVLSFEGKNAKFDSMLVSAWSSRDRFLVVLAVDFAGRRLISTLGHYAQRPTVLEGLGQVNACFGFGPGTHSWPVPVIGFASESVPKVWQVYALGATLHQVTLEEPDDVVAVVGNYGLRPGVIVQSAGRRTLTHVSGLDVRRVLTRTRSPIAGVATDHNAARIAWVEEDGSIGLIWFRSEVEVLKGSIAEEGLVRFRKVKEGDE
jgi:hypothetical protein